MTRYALLLLLVFISCQTKEGNPLLVTATRDDFRENPALLERILETPHGYFRYINIPFSQYICETFTPMIEQSPLLNLHGDAHLEQYAVTDLGRGLTDFDDSSTGPGIVDIMRFTVSLRLACEQLGWQDQADSLVNTFLNAYLEALQDTSLNPAEPEVAQRIRSEFSHDRGKYFGWIRSVMQPMTAGEKDSLIIAMRSYVRTQLLEKPDTDSRYYHIVSTGRLQMGIGSALDMKYLVRIDGPSPDSLDDVVLECKQVRNLEGIDCIKTGQPQDPFRILLGQARIAYQPFHNLGYFRFRGHNFWVHSWVDNYKEMSIADSYQTPDELRQVVYDIGVQLGKGHVKQISTPFDLQVRLEEIHMVEQFRPQIIAQGSQMTWYVIDAWQHFRDMFAD